MDQRNGMVFGLAITLALFEVGSTTLFLIAPEAKQDAWIAMALAAGIGFMLLALYTAIYKINPQLDLFELCSRYMGRWLGSAVAFAFTGYFAYESSRNLRDLGELTTLILLNRTPLLVILVITILVVGNTTRYGARVLVLVCLVLLPMMLISYLFLNVMFISLNIVHFYNMLPVLENGWGPIWKAAVPRIVSFPFGQTVLFLVFFPLAKSQVPQVRRAVFIAYAIVSVILIALNQVNILVLGPGLAKDSTIPLLQSVQLIEFANVFERMDIFFVLVLFLGLGIKIAGFYVGAAAGLHRITGIGYKKCVLPIGAVIFASSLISPNYVHHIWMGKIVTYWDPIFQVAFPLILFAVMLVRRSKRSFQK